MPVSTADVQLRHVTKRYGTHDAVDDIMLEIQRGQFVSLLGPSGCGKTTTLRMLAGFIEPTSGEIHIAGRNMRGVPPYRRPVNMVFQNYALFPHMSVADNVAYGPRRRGMPKRDMARAVTEALALVNLEDFGGRHPRELSGGQQQRVALARALVNRPQVLLLDEPLGALDLKLRKQMQIELKRLHEQLCITFVYVTHDQEEALVMSDQVAVMNAGRIEQIADPYTVYERPATAFVADFIGQTNLLSCQVVGIESEHLALQCDDVCILADGTAIDTSRQRELRISLRPERITILTDGPAMDNDFPATVDRRVYLGTLVSFYVTVGQNLSLVVTTSDQRLARELDRNSQVRIGWHAGDETIVDS